FTYARDGDRFAHDLRGMYAIALDDPKAPVLYLARDPFGIKPLYCVQGAFGLAFASEPRALIRAGFAAPQVMPGKARELLQLQFTTGRQTIFRGIERVLPGETIAIRNGRIAHR